MNKYLKGAFVANAASMGFNWIYNLPYLEKLSQTQSLVFQAVDPLKYKRAGKSYLAYPNAKIGDLSAQGHIAKQLYNALYENSELTTDAYKQIVLEMIKPGGTYEGWVESYGKKLVYNQLIEQLNIEAKPIIQTDDQLVGFVPYIVCKELNLPSEKAWVLAQAFTNIDTYNQFYLVFDQLFENLKSINMNAALKNVVSICPQEYQENINHAIDMNDTNSFIINHSGTACHIHHAIPLIFHILAHTNSYEEAVQLNVKIGGASCDRGMMIGAIYSQVSTIPEEWSNLTNLKL